MIAACFNSDTDVADQQTPRRRREFDRDGPQVLDISEQTAHSRSDGGAGTGLPFAISCRAPFLTATFEHPQAMLSWSLTKPGFQSATQVAWLEVRNRDLPPGHDPMVFIEEAVTRAGLTDAVLLVTSRTLARHHVAEATVEGCRAVCLATVGLSNGERVGERSRAPVSLPGTINILLHVSKTLSPAAMIETVSIVTQARTLAVIEANVERGGVPVTGTGTDCIVVASPVEGPAETFAGLHTAIGEAAGKAVYHAMAEGIAVWRRDFYGETGPGSGVSS
jgi:adenosylcobinamide amidohydrolase